MGKMFWWRNNKRYLEQDFFLKTYERIALHYEKADEEVTKRSKRTTF